MDASRQMGPAINKARNVTQTELTIKVSIPKCPDIGRQSEENKRLAMLCSLSNGSLLIINPIPINTGIMITKLRLKSIQLLAILSRKRRLTVKNFLFIFNFYFIFSSSVLILSAGNCTYPDSFTYFCPSIKIQFRNAVTTGSVGLPLLTKYRSLAGGEG
jgi:hypothetical protein